MSTTTTPMHQLGAQLWQHLHTLQIYGANTDVGKTIVSTILCKALAQDTRKYAHINYIKPVSTGPSWEADDRHIKKYAPRVVTECLFQFSAAVSPHLAARKDSQPPLDSEILRRVSEKLADHARAGKGITILETAGGVMSPGPSGTVQADLYRPLRLPVLLVGDSKLGGIGTTISAYESLHVRGYDVDMVMVFDHAKYGNADYLVEYFRRRGIHTVSLLRPPTHNELAHKDKKAMANYYRDVSSRFTINVSLRNPIHVLEEKHNRRRADLAAMAERTQACIWHPFTQHQSQKASDILVIDSAHGDSFATWNPPADYEPPTDGHEVRKRRRRVSKAPDGGVDSSREAEKPLLRSAFDGSASWWTQGLGHGNPELALTAAHAAGRYGHVMFAGAVHEPALLLAERLLKGLGNPRLKKVFYTDNGSTGMEVAVKMALRASCVRYGWKDHREDISILGLKGSYHGDTIGAMDCSEPSPFNGAVTWYTGKGHWFDFPRVKLRKGKWIVEMPMGLEKTLGAGAEYESLNEVFDLSSRDGAVYESYIRKTLNRLVKQGGKRFGALVMEPVLLGAGGMLLCDPLFQASLIRVVRSYPHFSSTAQRGDVDALSWTGLPVVFDEVFTGLYRLGRFSSASFLEAHADISVHAKLLTGGLLPLCATVASQSIFDAFLGTEKGDALLHGHSYTAHPIGCQVANTSLRAMAEMESEGRWSEFRQAWSPTQRAPGKPGKKAGGQQANSGVPSDDLIWSMWSRETATELSHGRQVESVVAIGSVLAVTLRDEEGKSAGYASNAAAGLQAKLLDAVGERGLAIHCRVLGNVMYLITSLTSDGETVRAVEGVLRGVLCNGRAGG